MCIVQAGGNAPSSAVARSSVAAGARRPNTIKAAPITRENCRIRSRGLEKGFRCEGNPEREPGMPTTPFERRGDDSDDRERLTRQFDRRADNLRICGKARPPQPLAEHGHPGGIVIIRDLDRAAKGCGDAKRREEPPRPQPRLTPSSFRWTSQAEGRRRLTWKCC